MAKKRPIKKKITIKKKPVKRKRRVKKKLKNKYTILLLFLLFL